MPPACPICSLSPPASFLRVLDLNNEKVRFKIDANAREFNCTGCVVLFPQCNVVVVEAGKQPHIGFNELHTRTQEVEKGGGKKRGRRERKKGEWEEFLQVATCGNMKTRPHLFVLLFSGPKAVKKYIKLMLNRIKWVDEDKADEEDMEVDEDDEDGASNKCVLAWQVRVFSVPALLKTPS